MLLFAFSTNRFIEQDASNSLALFLTSAIYKEYAKRYLEPHQINEVDISDYIDEKIEPFRPGNQATE